MRYNRKCTQQQHTLYLNLVKSPFTLTDSGVFTVSALEADLKSGRSPLSNLSNAAQEVITQYRLMQQTK
jgi:hypothetical protein